VGYFAQQVPDPTSIVIDGKRDDWDWFLSKYVIGRDQMASIAHEMLGSPIPSLSDIDITVMVGWTPKPDNRLYIFVQVEDDSLNIDEVVMDNGWRDDDLEIIIDADHGEWHEASDALRTGHQQWTFHIPTPGGYPQVAYLRYRQPSAMQWAIDEGLIKAAVNCQPEAVHLAANVTVGYEISMPLWDYYSPEGADASVRHELIAGQTIGMSVTLNEADTDREDQISTHLSAWGAHDSDLTSEFTLMSGVPTEVSPFSWGVLKTLVYGSH